MARPKGSFRQPTYRLHKASNRAIVTIAGRDYYLGAPGSFGSQASRSMYHRLLMEAESRGGIDPATNPTDVRVVELIAGYWAWAQKRFAKTGGPRRFVVPLRVLREMYGDTLANDFTPTKLRAVREAFVNRTCTARRKGEPYSLQHVNTCTKLVRGVFAWGVENDLISGSVAYALRKVRQLNRNETSAPVNPRIKAVGMSVVEATLPFLSPMHRAMVKLQAASGMRCGEIFVMRRIDIDMTGETWIYRPAQHKTSHRDISRVVGLDKIAQEIISEWLKDDPQAYIFTPEGGAQSAIDERRRLSKCPTSLLDYNRDKALSRQRRLGAKPARFNPRFTNGNYANLIRKACDRADSAAHKENPDIPVETRIVPRWHSHQLRHAFAIMVKRKIDKASARVLLSHQNEATTDGYLEDDSADEVREIFRKL